MRIDEKTHVPLFAVVASVPFIFGAIFWLTTIDLKASASQEDLKNLRPLVQDIHDRVIRIDEFLRKNKNNNKESL
jgi:hypothetical protein